MLSDQLSHDSHVGLPLLFAWLLVVFEEIVVRLEHRHLKDFSPQVGIDSLQNGVGCHVRDGVLSVDKGAIVLEDDRLDRVETYKCSLLPL